ncbi:unnamed protein product [Urochloa humidicola]
MPAAAISAQLILRCTGRLSLHVAVFVVLALSLSLKSPRAGIVLPIALQFRGATLQPAVRAALQPGRDWMVAT